MATDCSLAECLGFFDDILLTLKSGFAAIEAQMPRPRQRIRSGNVEVRYEQPSIELALFLKLARAISLLGGLRLMVENGMIQEQGILERAIDETDEDILFLSFGHQNGIEGIHKVFLDAFWSEEFEDPNVVLNHKRRESLPRRKIQAFNAGVMGASDPSTAQSVDRLIQGVFSGYVHGASVHILDLYDLSSRRFCVEGLAMSPVRQSYITDACNYPYRVLMSAVLVSRRLGLGEIAEGFFGKLKKAERFIGMPTDDEARQLISKMKGKR